MHPAGADAETARGIDLSDLRGDEGRTLRGRNAFVATDKDDEHQWKSILCPGLFAVCILFMCILFICGEQLFSASVGCLVLPRREFHRAASAPFDRYHTAVDLTPNSPSQPIQPFQHSPVAARVPEKVARGVYSTAQLVLDSPKEFIIDFFQGLTRPHQVVARLVLAPQTVVEFRNALETNLAAYTNAFGPPAPLPVPPNQNRPTLQEIYDNYKVPEDIGPGAYANSVLIGHSPAEFFFDFITNFYPTSVVSARVFMPAPVVPRFLNTVTSCIQQHQQRMANLAAQQQAESHPGSPAGEATNPQSPGPASGPSSAGPSASESNPEPLTPPSD